MPNLRPHPKYYWWLVASQVVLLAYYLFVFRPLSQDLQALDQPLTMLWQQLSATNAETKTLEIVDFKSINQTFEEVLRIQARLQLAKAQLRNRLELDPSLHLRLHEPLQLIDYQNERQQVVEELLRLAGTHKAKLDPELLEALPRYPLEQDAASLIWGQLSLAHHVLYLALQCRVSEVLFLNVPALGNLASSQNSPVLTAKIQIGFRFAGTMEAISKLLASLPLREQEITSLSLPEAAHAKPPVFIEKLMVRKRSAQHPDDVQLDLDASLFVLRHPSVPPPEPAQGSAE